MRTISVLQMSWMGSILILFIILIRCLFIQKLPKALFLILWEMTALRLLIPVSIPLPVPALVFTELPLRAVHRGVESNIHETVVPAVSGGPSVITVLWCIGSSFLIMWFVWSYVRNIHKFRESLPCKNQKVDNWVKEQRGWRTFEVRESDRIASPLTYGIFKPVILLPKKLVQSDPDAMTAVLLHEYVHIQRFDGLAKLFFAGALCIHWWNPMIWVFYVFANRDMELSCDAAVIRRLGVGQRSFYALALIQFEETQTQYTALQIYFSRDAVTERIESIMKFKKTSALAFIGAALAVVCATSAFAAGYTHDEGKTLPYGYKIDLNNLDIIHQEDGATLYASKDVNLADMQGGTDAVITYRVSGDLESLKKPFSLSELPSEVVSGPVDEESMGPLVSVAHDDQERYTPEQWDSILQKIGAGEIAWED